MILLVLIGLAASSCVKETTTKIISDDGKINQQNVPNPLAEGTVNGGGGKGVLCIRNGVQTVETLDLYEANVLYGLKSTYNPQTETEAMDLFATLLTKHFWNPSSMPLDEYKKFFLERIQNIFLKDIKFISPDKKLNFTYDSFEPLIEKNCEMVQVAHYYDESILLIDQTLWNQMNWLNKMALLTHEAVYSLDRSNGSTNSIASRKLVGQLFSPKGARPKADGIPSDRTQFASCHLSDAKYTTVGYFYAYNSIQVSEFSEKPENGLTFVFNFFLQNTNLFRTSFFLYQESLENLIKVGANGSGNGRLEVESYVASSQRLTVHLTGEGKGTMSVYNQKTGEITYDLSFSCYK